MPHGGFRPAHRTVARAKLVKATCACDSLSLGTTMKRAEEEQEDFLTRRLLE
jgi:hypothetical protein